MVLNLVDGWHDLGGLEDRLEVRLQEVANANATCAAAGLDGFKLGPLGLQLSIRGGKEGRVNEVKVHVVEAEFLEGGGDASLGVCGFGAGYFGGDEES